MSKSAHQSRIIKRNTNFYDSNKQTLEQNELRILGWLLALCIDLNDQQFNTHSLKADKWAKIILPVFFILEKNTLILHQMTGEV